MPSLDQDARATQAENDALVKAIPPARPDTEYVSGGDDPGYQLRKLLRGLPPHVDDVERDYGLDIYERMEHDPIIEGGLETLKGLIADELVLQPKQYPGEEEPDAKATKMADYVRGVFANTVTPIDGIQNELLDCLLFGHVLAEPSLELADDGDGFGLIYRLRDVLVRPRLNYALCTAPNGELVGVMPVLPGQGSRRSGPMSNVRPEDVVPIEHFVFMSIRPRYRKPGGRSMFRSSYAPWWFKQQNYASWLKNQNLWGTPGLVITTPVEDTRDYEDVDLDTGVKRLDGNGRVRKISAETAAYRAGLKFQEGSVLVLRGGSQWGVIQPSGGAEVFIATAQACNREMLVGILRNARAILEAEHGSKADTGNAQDMVKLLALTFRSQLAGVLERLAAYLIRLNFGDEWARYCPEVTIPITDPDRIVRYAQAIQQLWNAGYFHDSQVPDLDKLLGIDRDYEAWQADRMEEKDAAAQEAKARARVLDPLQDQGV